MTKVQRFKISIPIVKTSVKIVKDKEGNDVEERYVEGVASGTELDLHGDRMDPSAIESMAKSLKQHVVALNVEHDTSWSGELGDIDKLIVTDDNNLEIKAKLNEMSSSKDLWYALTEQNKKLGLSIGGFVKDYEMVKEGEGDDAKWVRHYKKIDLDHIAVTSSPAYPKAWVSNIAKSLESTKKMIKKIKDENKESVKEKSKRSVKNKKMRELARAIARSIQNLESDLLLELCYKGLKFCNKNQILLLERSLSMSKKDVSLEAGKAEKAEAKESKSTDKKVEKPAAPDNEKSKTESKDVKGKGTDKNIKEDKASEVKSKTPASESKDEVKDQDKSEKSKKIATAITVKVDTKELTKTVEKLSKSLETVLESHETLVKSNTKLQEKVESLEQQPASRKTIEVKKTLGGDEGEEEKPAKELKKERDSKIEEVRKEFVNDPSLFARIQRIRAEYSKRLEQ